MITDTHPQSILKGSGMRLTPQLLAITRLLMESREHPSAGMIYEQLHDQFPSLSLMTVYNTLNTLVKLGVINMLGSSGDDNVRYDGNISPHVNLACLQCHKVVDLPSKQIDSLDGEVRSTSGYQLVGSRVLYYGLCPECQKQPGS